MKNTDHSKKQQENTPTVFSANKMMQERTYSCVRGSLTVSENQYIEVDV